MTTYKNRYDDIFTFTEDDDNNILWEGDFDFCRIGYPNDYTKAYNAYVNDNKHSKNLMSFNQFKEVVHTYDDETHQYIYDKYNRMVESLKDEIDMVDTSGGCYLTSGMNLDFLGFKNYVIKDFKKIATGYKIITEKCKYCNLAAGNHKIGCEIKKITVFYDQMEKEVHQNNGNLNM